MQTFNEFTNKQQRDSKKQLCIVKKILESQKVSVSDHLQEEEPYIFVRNSTGNLSFDGIRIYKIGDTIAFRIQREEKTHPYGKSYILDIEEMFSDFMSDEKVDQEKAGKQVIKTVIEEIKNFFEKSAQAEADLKQSMFDKSGDPMGRTMMSTTGTDYANSINSSGNNFGGAAG